jgi:hypothetical protein
MASMVCSGSAPHPVADACWFPCWREHAGSAGARERGSARGIPARAEGDSARADLVLGLGALWVLGLDLGAALGCTRAGILGLGNARAREGESATPGPRLGAQGREWPILRACQEVFKVVGFFERAIFVFLRFSFKTKTSRFSLKHTSVF